MPRKPFILLSISLLLFILSGKSFGQIQDSVTTWSGFSAVKDDTIKSELSHFTKTGGLQKSAVKKGLELKIIPIKSIFENRILFEDGDFMALKLSVDIVTGNIDTNKHIFTYDPGNLKKLILIDDQPYFGTKGIMPKKEIKSIRLLFFKMQVTFPDSALKGIYEPNLYSDPDNKIPSCKVLRSKDRKRVYIYMLNGEGQNRYEVTWVLTNGKCKMRAIDKL